MMEAKWTKKTTEDEIDDHNAGNGIKADTREKAGKESMGMGVDENDEKRGRETWEVGEGRCL